MSKRSPVSIKLFKEYKLFPEDCFESVIVKDGNGAKIKAFKRYIGKEVIVMIKKLKKSKIKDEINDEELTELGAELDE